MSINVKKEEKTDQQHT